MKKITFLSLFFFSIPAAFAQDSLRVAVADTLLQKLIEPEKIVVDANYAGGSIEDLYYYVNNNFNYNNVKKEDVPNELRNRSHFIFYVVFAVSEDGKAFEFSPKEIEENNSFYQEAVRVIASTSWNVSTKDDVYEKQFMVIPIRANVMDW